MGLKESNQTNKQTNLRTSNLRDFTVQLTSDAVNTRYTGLPGVTRGISRCHRLHSQIIFVHEAVIGTGLAL